MFSEEGVKTVPEKIYEMQETPAPKRKKILTKFFYDWPATWKDLYTVIVQSNSL